MRKIIMYSCVFALSFLFAYMLVLNNKIQVLKSYKYADKIETLEKQYSDLYINIMYDFSLDSIDEVDYYFETLVNKTDVLKRDMKELNKSRESLEIQLSDLNKQRDQLVEKKKKEEELQKNFNNNLQQKDENKFLINNVGYLNQYDEGYPTGCESAALTLLLNYHGVNVKMSEVVNKLKKGDKPFLENNIMYGGNPYIEFIGHPSDPSSYGVFDKPIEAVANSFKEGIINNTGMSLDELLKVVKQNRPVLVWNSMNLEVPYIRTTWIYKKTGENIKWMSREHALLIIGYNDTHIITTDSLTGDIRYFDRDKFENRYNIFGKRNLYY